MTRRRNVNLTESQLDALTYACQFTLAGSPFDLNDAAKLHGPLIRAFEKVKRARENLGESDQ